MIKTDNFALVPRPPSALEKAEPGAKRLLAVMIAETLRLAHAQEPSAPPVIAATQVESWYQTGANYYFGRGVPQDYVQAAKWLRKAAEYNYAEAQFMLGTCYEYGDGMEKDCAEAAKWYREAAEQNHAKAQSNLGIRYFTGEGVEKDYAEAARWWRKATERAEARRAGRTGGGAGEVAGAGKRGVGAAGGQTGGRDQGVG